MTRTNRNLTRDVVGASVFLLSLAVTSSTCMAQGRDPRAEIELRNTHRVFAPPPVDEAGAARAERASQSRSRPASTSDQIELAIKRGNFAIVRVGGDRADTPEDLKFVAQAEANYERALRLNPKEWRALAGLGEVYSKKGRYGDAASAYERAVALRPRNSFLQVELAWAYSSDGKHSEAIRAYEKSIKIDPSLENESAYFLLAREYKRAGLIDEAIHTYEQLLTVNPNGLGIYSSIGELRFEQKKYEESIEAYKNQIRLHPNDLEAAEVLGDLYMYLKRFAEAIDTYRTYLNLPETDNAGNRNFYKLVRNTVIYKLGEAFLEIQDVHAARENHRELVRRDATWANRLLELINLSEEIESAKQMLRVNLDDAQAHLTIGNAYLKWEYRYSRFGRYKSHYAEAIEQYKEVIRLRPDFDGAHFNLGLAYFYNGNKGAAMEQSQALRQLNSAYADELLKVISK